MISSILVAETIFDIYKANGDSITNMKLQKLVYYLHQKYVSTYGKRLIIEDMYAWPPGYGSIEPNLYESLRYYGNGVVDKFPYRSRERPLTEDEMEFVTRMVEATREISEAELVEWDTSKYSPWNISRKLYSAQTSDFCVIPIQLMKRYHSDL